MKKTGRELKAEARIHLLGNYNNIIGATLLILAVVLLVSIPFLNMSLHQISLSSFVIVSVANYLIGALGLFFLCGVLHMHLQITKNAKTSFANLAFPIKNQADRFLTACFVLTAIPALCQLPGNILLEIDRRMYALNPNTGNQYAVLGSVLVFVGTVVGLLLLLQYALTLFFLIEQPHLLAGEALRKSRTQMRGQKWRCFKLLISFIGLYILGILSFFIGFIWIIPYAMQSLTVFYLDVTGQNAQQTQQTV